MTNLRVAFALYQDRSRELPCSNLLRRHPNPPWKQLYFQDLAPPRTSLPTYLKDPAPLHACHKGKSPSLEKAGDCKYSLAPAQRSASCPLQRLRVSRQRAF